MLHTDIKMVIVPTRGTECIYPSWMKADNFQDFLLPSEQSTLKKSFEKLTSYLFRK